MDIEIYGRNYLNGMPTLEYKIKLGGIFIEIKKEDFKRLLNTLDKKIGADYEKALNVMENYNLKINNIKKLRNDIRNIFWDDLDGLFFRKPDEEIDIEKLDEILNNNKEFFGFE